MNKSDKWRRVPVIALLWVVLPALPACQGAGWGWGRQARRPAIAPATIPYSAYRPAISPGPPRRTFAIGGYAGYRYPGDQSLGLVPSIFRRADPGHGHHTHPFR